MIKAKQSRFVRAKGIRKGDILLTNIEVLVGKVLKYIDELPKRTSAAAKELFASGKPGCEG